MVIEFKVVSTKEGERKRIDMNTDRIDATTVPDSDSQERHEMNYISSRCYVLKDSSRIKDIEFGNIPELVGARP